MADSYVTRAAQEAGAAAELAASHKLEKYANIDVRYLFEPIAVETLGVINTSACHFLNDLGKRMTVNSGEARETGFLYQRISVFIQRYNAVLLHDGLPESDDSTD